jgi:hypothetical protein
VVQSAPGLVERVEKHLVQIDVSIDGPPETTRALTIGDFALTIAGKPVVPVALDRLCGNDATTAPASSAPTSYLFYFDQRMLTMQGRSQSLDAIEVRD